MVRCLKNVFSCRWLLEKSQTTCFYLQISWEQESRPRANQPFVPLLSPWPFWKAEDKQGTGIHPRLHLVLATQSSPWLQKVQAGSQKLVIITTSKEDYCGVLPLWIALLKNPRNISHNSNYCFVSILLYHSSDKLQGSLLLKKCIADRSSLPLESTSTFKLNRLVSSLNVKLVLPDKAIYKWSWIW